ncbi:hypothetical protein C8Q77DRAFT_1052468 [Trametes polyzona]|nr:hypothetical protein C8Q77DRAFT_1052468 [Trametes polyzona]
MAVAGVAAVPGPPSRARSDTPMSLTALPSSSTPRPTRQPSLLPHSPSEGQQLPTFASTSLVNPELRSPASADASLLSTTTPHPASPSAASVLPYPHSPSPAASVPALAETRDAFTPDHSDTSHHEPVTSLPVATSDSDAQDIPMTPIQDAMPAQTREQIPEAEQEPEGKTLVPAIWWAFEGKHHPSMQKIQFFVDDATADAAERWASRKESFSFEGKHVRVTVLCLPTATVSEVYQNLPPDASRADIVSALWNIKSEWPPLGTLIVQTPYERPIHMWVPPQHAGALDITHAIVRGENKFKLIQLADMSGKLFVFHASEPSDDEQLAIGTETMGWSRARTKLAPSSPPSSHFGSA